MKFALEYDRRNLRQLLLVLGALFAAIYLGLTLSRWSSEISMGSPYDSPIQMIGRISLTLFGLVLFGVFALRRRVEAMTAVLILLLPALSGRGLSFVVLYTDVVGSKMTLNLISGMLLATFLILVARDFAWIRQVVRTWMFGAFIILMLSGLFTQTYHLGPVAGFGVIYVRVVQPMIFIVLVSYFARSKQGLEKLFGCLVASVLSVIVLRYLSPLQTDPITGRVSAIGSWTIYGTILVAVLPLGICLWVTTKHLWLKILLPVASLLIASEVFLTQTRGAILALPVLGLFLIIRRSRGYIVIGILLLLLGGLGLNLNLEHLSGGRLYTLDPGVLMDDANWLGRLASNTQAWEYIQRHPVTGIGLGTLSMETAYVTGFWTYNPYLAWGVSMGIIAMLAFSLIMLLSVIHTIGSLISEANGAKIYPLSIFISLAAWLINQFTTGDSLTYLQPVESILFFYALIGIIVGQQMAQVRHANDQSLIIRDETE